MSLELRMKSRQEMGVAAQGFRGKHRVFLDSEWSHTQILPLAGIVLFQRVYIHKPRVYVRFGNESSKRIARVPQHERWKVCS